MIQDTPRVLVLGIGNLLWADEGFGVRAVQLLQRDYRFGPEVRLLDGGTQGLYLLHHVQEADVLLVFDAVDYGLAPGSLHCVFGDEVPRFMGARKVSLHQTGFQEVLLTAELLGGMPRHLALVGVQPQMLEDFGGSLTPPVRAQLEPAVAAGLSWLAGLGVTGRRRDETGEPELLGAEALELARYEAGRPDACAAPRHGDPRVLADARLRFDPKPACDVGTRISVDVDSRRPI